MMTRFAMTLFACVGVLSARGAEKIYRTAQPASAVLKAGEMLEVKLSEAPRATPNTIAFVFEIRQVKAVDPAKGDPGAFSFAVQHSEGRSEAVFMRPALTPGGIPADGSWRECAIEGWVVRTCESLCIRAPAAQNGGEWEIRNMRVMMASLRPQLGRLFNRGYLEWAGNDRKKYNGEWFAGTWDLNWRISSLPYQIRAWGDKTFKSDPISMLCVNGGQRGALQLSETAETAAVEDDGLGEMLANDDGVAAPTEEGVVVEMPAGDPMKYLYLMHSLVGGTPKFKMDIRFTDRKGQSALVHLKWGEDVRDWLDVEPKRNCFNEHVYAVNARRFDEDVGMQDCDAAAASTTIIQIPKELGAIASVAFLPRSDQDQGVFMVHDFFLSNVRHAVNRRPVERVLLGEKWRPAAFPHRKRGIKAGSPMDRSPKKRQSVAELGRIVSNGKGDFVFERDPDQKPIRWLSTGGTILIDRLNGLREISLRNQIRRHNQTREGKKNPWPEHPLARPDWAIDPEKALTPTTPQKVEDNRAYLHQQIEAAIERDYRAGYRVRDLYEDGTSHSICAEKGLEFDEEILDALYYTIKCMEDRGMYMSWSIGMNVCYPGPPYNPEQWPKEAFVSPWGEGELNKINMERCKQATRQLLCGINPYTGKKLIESDTLVTLLLWNESLFFKAAQSDIAVIRAELKKKYGNGEEGLAKIRAAWNGEKNCWAKKGQGWSSDWDSFDMIKIGDWLGEKSQRGTDLLEICRSVGESRINYWRDFLRSLGFKGLITDTNMVHDFLRMLPRSVKGSYVSCNTYHSHPLGTRPPYRVAHIWQDSSIRQFCAFYRGLAQGRIQGHPIVITEGDFPWMNKYRYEQAFVMNALCGMNGFSWMKSFSGGGIPAFYYEDELKMGRTRALGNFNGRDDPIKWASEYLGWWIQAGECVAQSDLRFRIDVPMDEVEREHLWNTGIGEESSLAFLGRVSVNFVPKGEKPPAPDASLKEMAISRVGRGSSFAMGGTGGLGGDVKDVRFANVVLNDDGSLNLTGIVDELKRRGWIRKDNRTNPQTGEFESSTGELYLNAPKSLATIQAPRMRALFSAGYLEPIAGFRISRFEPYGIAAVVALDGRPIEKSEEMMLVFATDAMNRNMIFDSPSMATAICIGHGPAVMRAGRLTCEITNEAANGFTMTSLYPDGDELEDLSACLKQGSGRIAIDLDTSKLDCVSPFYYLKRK